MSAPRCPYCQGAGRLATKVLFDLWRCTKCHKEYWSEHAVCQDPNCSSWTDGGTDFCWFHAAQRGIHPEEHQKDPSLCHAPECTRPIGERTKEALGHKKARMEFVGNCPYGFRLCADGRTLEPDPAEQRVRRTITRLREQGWSLRQIAAYLNRERRFTRSGSPWMHCYVARVLKAA